MGMTGCCNKSEKRKYPSTPRVFCSYIIFARMLRDQGGGAGPWGYPVGHPKPARSLRPSAAVTNGEPNVDSPAKFDTAKRRNRECRSERCRPHRNRWQLQGALAINTAQQPRGTGGCPPNPPDAESSQSRFRYRVALKIVRRSADKTWHLQWWLSHTAGARDWPLETVRKGNGKHSSETSSPTSVFAPKRHGATC